MERPGRRTDPDTGFSSGNGHTDGLAGSLTYYCDYLPIVSVYLPTYLGISFAREGRRRQTAMYQVANRDGPPTATD